MLRRPQQATSSAEGINREPLFPQKEAATGEGALTLERNGSCPQSLACPITRPWLVSKHIGMATPCKSGIAA